MTHRALANLTTDEFAIKYAFTANPRVLHRAMQHSEEVKALRLALQSGEVTEETIRAFVNGLLGELERGQRLPQELALAATAVALETRSTSFAQEYVTDLARLELAELPVAIRVAREACREQLSISGNRTKVFSYGGEAALPTQWQQAPKPRPIMVGQSAECLELETS